MFRACQEENELSTVTPKKKSIYYIDNKKFYEEMRKYIYACREAEECEDEYPQVPNYIGECFMKIANKLASKYRFVGYSYKEEMVDDGIENCIRYIKSFNPDKSNNPFSYFTQTVKNSFFHRINNERKEQYIKWKSMENMILGSSNFTTTDGGDYAISPEIHENMQRFISEYEEAAQEKRDKFKKKAKESIFDEGTENE